MGVAFAAERQKMGFQQCLKTLIFHYMWGIKSNKNDKEKLLMLKLLKKCLK